MKRGSEWLYVLPGLEAQRGTLIVGSLIGRFRSLTIAHPKRLKLESQSKMAH
jgi:hypothetical protein